MDSFLRFQIHVHERVGFSQAEVYESVGKSTIERKLLEILFYLVLHENDK